ncbi:MAG TPA: methyltransferase domain-containing protein [Longimicrobiales bacterium]|nr:methyltransferase domain-containing protein [Longimicrobiales bacterium]
MGLYSKYVLPRLIHLACGSRPITRQRAKIVPRASGRVLEIGIGSGLNLPFYDPARVTEVLGLDPAPELTDRARRAAHGVPMNVEFVSASAEEIPLEAASFDTVVVTYTLCSIPDVSSALAEMRRVLRPGGSLLFCEHGRAPDASVERWQNRIDPLWKRLAGGCHLSRDIPALLRASGFETVDLESTYIPGWRPASFNYWGAAGRDSSLHSAT